MIATSPGPSRLTRLFVRRRERGELPAGGGLGDGGEGRAGVGGDREARLVGPGGAGGGRWELDAEFAFAWPDPAELLRDRLCEGGLHLRARLAEHRGEP